LKTDNERSLLLAAKPPRQWTTCAIWPSPRPWKGRRDGTTARTNS
jgi:hypothetical protein